MLRLVHWASLLALLALFVLITVWAFATETGDGWPALALLAVPLVVPLPGMLRGRAGAFLLAAFLSLLYLFHGLVTLVTAPATRDIGTLEAALSLVLLVSASLRVRWSRGPL